MSLTLTYDSRLARVRADAAGLDPTALTVKLERQEARGVRWSTVRGAESVELVGTGTGLSIDDYEFTPDTPNTYRLTAYDSAGAAVGVPEEATITPNLAGRAWLKVVARPYLNRAVTVHDFTEQTIPARAGIYEVVGRADPVAVSDRRSSRRFALTIVAETAEESYELELLAATGDPIHLQVPADANMPRGGYFHVGDVTVQRPTRDSRRRFFTLPLTAIGAPGPDIVGAVSTWQTVMTEHPTWNDLLGALATWSDVVNNIAGGEVLVP